MSCVLTYRQHRKILIMSTNAKTAGLGLIWDTAVATSLGRSQRWVLVSMQKHGQGLVTMLWRILGNEHDVCDAYQQTFLNLAHYQQQGKTKPDNVQAFLFRTATNTAISMLRRKKTKQQFLTAAGKAGSVGHDVDYAHQLDTKLLQDKLRTAITELPDYLKEVVVLRDLAEMPYVKVAKILGIPAGTARVYRHKAITMLSVLMSKGRKG